MDIAEHVERTMKYLALCNNDDARKKYLAASFSAVVARAKADAAKEALEIISGVRS